MYSTEYLRDDKSSVFSKLVQTPHDEEIVLDHCLTFFQLGLCLVVIKVNVERLNEFSNRVFIGLLEVL